jgi:uncharacterized membrane protein YdjX (TVP38/TMEM64 family)
MRRERPDPEAPLAEPGGHAASALVRFGWARALLVILASLALAVALSVESVRGLLHQALLATGPWMQAHPVAGPLGFVVLSALSALLAFVSSAVLVPVAVFHWGRVATGLLLWSGWLLGGGCAYAIGRWLGAPLLRAARPAGRWQPWLRQLASAVGFSELLLLQLALPSELPGYLCGLLRVRLRHYLPALALAELPYAVGTVLLGEGVVRGKGAWVVVAAAASVIAGLLAAWLLRRKLRGH